MVAKLALLRSLPRPTLAVALGTGGEVFVYGVVQCKGAPRGPVEDLVPGAADARRIWIRTAEDDIETILRLKSAAAMLGHIAPEPRENWHAHMDPAPGLC